MHYLTDINALILVTKQHMHDGALVEIHPPNHTGISFYIQSDEEVAPSSLLIVCMMHHSIVMAARAIILHPPPHKQKDRNQFHSSFFIHCICHFLYLYTAKDTYVHYRIGDIGGMFDVVVNDWGVT